MKPCFIRQVNNSPFYHAFRLMQGSDLYNFISHKNRKLLTSNNALLELAMSINIQQYWE